MSHNKQFQSDGSGGDDGDGFVHSFKVVVWVVVALYVE